jgi:hypothetical protein
MRVEAGQTPSKPNGQEPWKSLAVQVEEWKVGTGPLSFTCKGENMTYPIYVIQPIFNPSPISYLRLDRLNWKSVCVESPRDPILHDELELTPAPRKPIQVAFPIM